MSTAPSDARRERARRDLALVLITDRTVCRGDLVDAVRRALDGGVTAVMLREKDLARDQLVRLGRLVGAACREAGASFLVNDDVDAAVQSASDGVHLGFRSVGVAQARAMIRQDALIGRSTHDAAEIDGAVLDGADYVTFGPVYDTPSKRGLLAPRGAAALADAVKRAGGMPVLALGGVTADRAAELRRAGAAGLACIREILAADDATAAARRLRASWETAQ